MDWGAILVSALVAATGPVAVSYVISGLGLNLQFGYTGLLNFGHVAFMMVGAYGTAIAADAGAPLWIAFPVGVLSAAVLGLLLGIPTLRLRAEYLAITTIAAAEVLRLLVRSSWAVPITGGVFGIQGFGAGFFTLSPFDSSAVYGLGPLLTTGRRLWVVLVGWTLALALVLVVRRLIHSPWGRLLRAIREDEDAARSLGKNTFAIKLQALMLGGALGGLAGALIAVERQSVTPDAFLPVVTFILYVAVILGGAGTVWGPMLGAVIFQFLFFFLDNMMRQAQANVSWVNAMISSAGAAQVRFVLVGVGLMLLLVFRPQGMLGSRKEAVVGGI
jgi:neutral amino acid transport system permease protein